MAQLYHVCLLLPKQQVTDTNKKHIMNLSPETLTLNADRMILKFALDNSNIENDFN